MPSNCFLKSGLGQDERTCSDYEEGLSLILVEKLLKTRIEIALKDESAKEQSGQN
jgi:hypothetical protein